MKSLKGEFMNSMVALILSSAAIGALVSSIITLMGQWIEKKSRLKELLLSKAIDLAQMQTKLLQEVGKDSGRPVTLLPLIVQTRWYHKQLSSLHSSNTLSPQLEELYKDYFKGPLDSTPAS